MLPSWWWSVCALTVLLLVYLSAGDAARTRRQLHRHTFKQPLMHIHSTSRRPGLQRHITTPNASSTQSRPTVRRSTPTPTRSLSSSMPDQMIAFDYLVGRASATIAPPARTHTEASQFVELPIPPPPAAKSAAPALERGRVVLTREVYVSGHERPHPELCPALGARLRLLVLVTSAPSHAAARDAVRLTWGHYAQRTDVALAFVLGAPPDALRPAIAAEDALYGDIIVGRSLDSPLNMTLRTLSLLEWMDTYCKRVPRLLKTNDDMFINVPQLLNWMKAPERKHEVRTIWGAVVEQSLPRRSPQSRFYVPLLQYPETVYPDYTAGAAYLLTRDAVRPLLQAAPAQPYMWLEDVFVTGVLAARLGVKRMHEPAFYNKEVTPHPCTVQRGIAMYVVRYQKQFDLWRKLIDRMTKCTDSEDATTPMMLYESSTHDSPETTTALVDLDVIPMTEYN